MITLHDIIVYKDISCSNELLEQIKIIAMHTQNTWQQNRTLDDIIQDTTIGKIAEHTLKEHMVRHSSYGILDYDDFRINNYKNKIYFLYYIESCRSVAYNASEIELKLRSVYAIC